MVVVFNSIFQNIKRRADLFRVYTKQAKHVDETMIAKWTTPKSQKLRHQASIGGRKIANTLPQIIYLIRHALVLLIFSIVKLV